MSTKRSPRVLIMCLSQLAADPRVLTQIDWLEDLKFEIDTVGLGAKPHSFVSRHLELEPRRFSKRVANLMNFVFRPNKNGFLRIAVNLVSRDQLNTLANSNYDLVIVNDIDLLPVAELLSSLSKSKPRPWLHLDLHEFHTWSARSESSIISERFGKYHNWLCTRISSEHIRTYSTVSENIGQLYQDQYGIDNINVIRNSKPYLEITPKQTPAGKIRCIYHGYAELSRGLEQLIMHASQLRAGTELYLMLTGNREVINQLRYMARQHGQGKVFVIDPVPMPQVSQTLNDYDVSLCFFPPVNPSFLNALPNKFFEAIQARIAIVSGESPEMASIIREYGLGWVVEGWDYTDLVKLLNRLNSKQINDVKTAVNSAANALNSGVEEQTFKRLFAPLSQVKEEK